jgi:hypothetical protein
MGTEVWSVVTTDKDRERERQRKAKSKGNVLWRALSNERGGGSAVFLFFSVSFVLARAGEGEKKRMDEERVRRE